MSLLTLPAAFILAGLLIWGLNELALISWRRSSAKHWTERARILYPNRTSAAFNFWLIPLNTTLVLWILVPGTWLMVTLVFLAALMGSALGSYPFHHELFPDFTLHKWLRYLSGNILLRLGLLLVLVIVTTLMPDEFGWPSVVLGSVVIAYIILANFGMWSWLARHVGLLTSPPERLTTIVGRTCDQLGVKCHAVWVLRSPVGYAAALPTTHELIFSDGVLASLPDNEISAICAHELAHLSESPRVKWSRIASQMWIVALVYIRPVAHAYDFSGLIFLIVPVGIIWFYSHQLGRRMEVRADSVAKETQQEAGVYASALERLYRTNHMPAVMGGRRKIHPHLFDRMLAAGVTPDYPRPLAPESYSWQWFLMLIVSGILLGWCFSR